MDHLHELQQAQDEAVTSMADVFVHGQLVFWIRHDGIIRIGALCREVTANHLARKRRQGRGQGSARSSVTL